MIRLLAVPLDASDVFNEIHDTAGFLYGTIDDGAYSRRFRYKEIVSFLFVPNAHSFCRPTTCHSSYEIWDRNIKRQKSYDLLNIGIMWITVFINLHTLFYQYLKPVSPLTKRKKNCFENHSI